MQSYGNALHAPGALSAGAAMALLLLDALVSLWLRGSPGQVAGRWPHRRPAGGRFFPPQARLMTRRTEGGAGYPLAYVKTGLDDVDSVSQAGLTGLGLMLKARTSYEPLEPMGLDPERDDLSLYPLLYWPMDPREKNLSPKGLARIGDYMRNGGTILFDTRDFTLGAVRGAASPGQQTLQRLTSGLDLPPLEQVPADHVLTKTFYILRDFPGRWTGGQLWVEALPPAPKNGAPPARGGDGVSPVVIGGNDWAAAWAVDGAFMSTPSPGGEMQREMAFRFGVNLVMCADQRLQDRCGACAGAVAAARDRTMTKITNDKAGFRSRHSAQRLTVMIVLAVLITLYGSSPGPRLLGAGPGLCGFVVRAGGRCWSRKSMRLCRM
jgi:hypothetical protein